jgi:hypothetical protein
MKKRGGKLKRQGVAPVGAIPSVMDVSGISAAAGKLSTVPYRPQSWWDRYAGFENMVKVRTDSTGKAFGYDTRAADAAIAGTMRQAETVANPLRTAIIAEGFPKYYGGGQVAKEVGKSGVAGWPGVKVGGVSEEIASQFISQGLGGKFVKPTPDMMLAAGVPKARVAEELVRPLDARFEMDYKPSYGIISASNIVKAAELGTGEPTSTGGMVSGGDYIPTILSVRKGAGIALAQRGKRASKSKRMKVSIRIPKFNTTIHKKKRR